MSTASARAGGIGSGGGGAITSCSTAGGVLYENGTANTATCSSIFTYSPLTGLIATSSQTGDAANLTLNSPGTGFPNAYLYATDSVHAADVYVDGKAATVIFGQHSGTPTVTIASNGGSGNISTTGHIRLTKAGSINWRNNADGGDVGWSLSGTDVLTANTPLAANALTCGVLNTTSCVLTGYGSTSGTATLTWPAVAGTTTNAIVSSNVWSAPAFTATGTTAGFADYAQGTTSAAVAPCNTSNSICEQAPSSVTSYLVNKPGVSANGIITNNVAAAVDTQGFSGDGNHSTTVTTGSGTSIGSTILCSSTNCPAGTYIVNAYIDITTACGTSGTYLIDLIYTDDQGAKTAIVNIQGSGAVPATGVLTTTSTANYGEAAQVIRLTSGNLNYSTTAVSCGSAGPMVGKLYLSAVPVM